MAAARQPDDGDGEQPRNNTISASDCIGLPRHYDICCRVSSATGGPSSDSEHFWLVQGLAKPFGATLMMQKSVGMTFGSRGRPKCICTASIWERWLEIFVRSSCSDVAPKFIQRRLSMEPSVERSAAERRAAAYSAGMIMTRFQTPPPSRRMPGR